MRSKRRRAAIRLRGGPPHANAGRRLASWGIHIARIPGSIEKGHSPLQGSEARHLGSSQQVEIQHPRHRQLVERRLVAPAPRKVARQPLLDTPPGLPRRAIPNRASAEPRSTVEQLAGHEFEAWQEHDFVLRVKQDDRRRKGKTETSKPGRHPGPSIPRTGIVFVPQDQQRVDIRLGADEFRTSPQAPLQMEIRPTHWRRPCESRVAVRGQPHEKIPDRRHVALPFHEDVRFSRSAGHLANLRSRKRSPSVVINSPSLSRPLATASR